ncbi:MAG: hypothetical protein ABUL49_01935, partial [bacterium]
MRSATALVVVLIPLASLAQEKDPITADRPGITTPTVVLGKGALQVETGLTYQWAQGSYTLGFPDPLFRYGIGHNQELRLLLLGYRWNSSGGTTNTGASDGYIGGKFGLGKVADLDLAAVIGLNVPSKSNGFSTGSVDPDIILAWSKAINDKWSVAGQFHGTYTTDASGRIWFGQGTLSLGRTFNSKSYGFVEYARNVVQGGPPDDIVDLGAALLTSRDT